MTGQPPVIHRDEELDALPAGSILAVEKHYQGATWSHDAAVKRPDGDWVLTDSARPTVTMLLKAHFHDPTLVFRLAYTPGGTP